MTSMQFLSLVSKRRQAILNEMLKNRDWSKKRVELEAEATAKAKAETYNVNGVAFKFECGKVVSSAEIK